MAANPNYGSDGEIPVAPRGSGIQTVDGFKERTPFESQFDIQASYAVRMAGERRVTFLADVFNLFNQRRVTNYNQNTQQEQNVTIRTSGSRSAPSSPATRRSSRRRSTCAWASASSSKTQRNGKIGATSVAFFCRTRNIGILDSKTLRGVHAHAGRPPHPRNRGAYRVER